MMSLFDTPLRLPEPVIADTRFAAAVERYAAARRGEAGNGDDGTT